MLDAGPAVSQAVVDALLEDLGDFFADSGWDIFADHISTQRKRQPRPCLPPRAQIEHEPESLVQIGQLPLVDDEASLGPASLEKIEDLIKRHYRGIQFTREQAEREVSARPQTGHRQSLRSQPGPNSIGFRRYLLLRHQHRAVAIAHARSAR